MNQFIAILFLLLGTDVFAQVHALTEDQEGTIWVAGENRLLRILPGGKIESVGNLVKTETIKALASGKNRVLWIGTEGGLFRCEKGSCTIDSRIPAGPVRSISIDHDQSIWIATDKEVLKLDHGASISKPVQTNRVEALAIDGKGNVWLGSGHELIRWNEPKEVFTLPPPPPNVRMRPPVTSILPSRSEKIYVGTHMGLLLLTGKIFKKVSDADVLALLEDSKGNIWVGTSDGLKRMTNGKMINVSLPQQ